MPGSNAGTGRPLWFRCAACRRAAPSHRIAGLGSHTYTCGMRLAVKLTGRSRTLKPGNNGGRNSGASREYTCLCCGHVGWSRHIDLEQLEHSLDAAVQAVPAKKGKKP